MAEREPSSILRRKAAAGTRDHRARAMTVAKSIRQSVAKEAAERFDLALSAIGIVVEKRAVEDVEELLDDSALLMLFDGTQGRSGAVSLAPVLADGLIQQQTMGAVRPPMGDARRVTDTDAALASPLIEAVLRRASSVAEAEEDQKLLGGYRFGVRAEEARVVLMALEAHEYSVIRLTLDMSKGARQGDLTIILPLPEKATRIEEPVEEDGGKASAKAMTELVFSLNALLKMELCRLKLPLSELAGMQPGATLELPPGTFPKARVLAVDGTHVGTGTIGQVEGLRALRLDPDPIFATQPRRRASDQEEDGVPSIDPLNQGRRAEDKAGDDFSAGATIAPLGTEFPALGGDDLPEAGALPPQDLPDLPELPETADLPDLPSLPDLPDLPDLSEASSGPQDMALPELDDLPNLAELPDLDIAKAG